MGGGVEFLLADTQSSETDGGADTGRGAPVGSRCAGGPREVGQGERGGVGVVAAMGDGLMHTGREEEEEGWTEP